jgi:hypothetical protein
VPAAQRASSRLSVLAERIRPPALAGAGPRLVPVAPPLAPLLPDGGLRRGSLVSLDPLSGCGCAATSLAGALVAGASGEGSWCAVVGMPELGLAAVAEMGADLSRVALVPAPGRSLTTAVAALLDAFDLVLLSHRARPTAGDARRLAARARERGAVLVTMAGSAWPAPTDIRLTVVRAEWQGLGLGEGRLLRRLVELEMSGRGAAARERRSFLWLPSPLGTPQQVLPEELALFGLRAREAEEPALRVVGAG